MKRNTVNILIIFLFSIQMSCSTYEKLTVIKSFEDLSYPFLTKKVTLSDGVTIAYSDEGTGAETIIFVHGLGSYAPAWKKNVEVLKSNFRCIAIDLPGYGKSSKQPHSGMMTYYADEIMKFAEAIGLQKFTLAGHSMGGQISMVAAMMYPEKVQRIILVDPAGFERFTEGQKQWFKKVMTVDGVKLTNVEQIQSNLATNFYNVPADAEFMVTDRIIMRTAVDFEAYCYAVVQSVNGMISQPVIDKLDKISQPTLILFGENDNLIPNRYLNPGFTKPIAEFGASQIKGSKLVMIPKCGHFAQFEQAAAVNEAIKEFFGVK